MSYCERINTQQKRDKKANSNQSRQIPIMEGSQRRSTIQRFKMFPQSIIRSGVIQCCGNRWKQIDNTNKYYWAGRGEPNMSLLPHGGIPVTMEPASLQDTHSSRHRNMTNLRTVPDYPTAGMDLLSHAASQARDNRGIFYSGSTEKRKMGTIPVIKQIPARTSVHAGIFSQMTGGHKSASEYQESIGTRLGNTKYEILHGAGHGQVGSQSQNSKNLGSASFGANSEMIPFDDAVTGNTDVSIDTSFNMRPDTQRIESIDQLFVHKNMPYFPFFHRKIDGDRPTPTKSEYEALIREASVLKNADKLSEATLLMNLSHPDISCAATALVDLSHPNISSTSGRSGQFAPGNHPLDRRPHRDDDMDTNS